MTLAELLNYIKTASTKDIYQVLSDVNGAVTSLADGIGVASLYLFIAALVLTVGVGFFGYKLIKLVSSLAMAYVGYFMGIEFFNIIQPSLSWLPQWSSYVIAAVIAIAFLLLAFSKFSYTVFTLSAVIGYFITMFYVDNPVFAVGGALVFAMLSVHFLRIVFIAETSFAGGLLAISFLSQIFPDVALFDIAGESIPTIILTYGVVLVFAVVQFVINRNDPDLLEG